ncbi:hypothetical protein WMY93_034141 [Mugilogobius chulae]|uniref:Uncharacterized protein n=1 Tax=Mugilogobius chulae TaxID=88201 RepID=A0AAW0MKP6_9GOBI
MWSAYPERSCRSAAGAHVVSRSRVFVFSAFRIAASLVSFSLAAYAAVCSSSSWPELVASLLALLGASRSGSCAQHVGRAAGSFSRLCGSRSRSRRSGRERSRSAMPVMRSPIAQFLSGFSSPRRRRRLLSQRSALSLQRSPPTQPGAQPTSAVLRLPQRSLPAVSAAIGIRSAALQSQPISLQPPCCIKPLAQPHRQPSAQIRLTAGRNVSRISSPRSGSRSVSPGAAFFAAQPASEPSSAFAAQPQSQRSAAA